MRIRFIFLNVPTFVFEIPYKILQFGKVFVENNNFFYKNCRFLISDYSFKNYDISFCSFHYRWTFFLGNKLTFVDKIWVMTQCNYFADPKVSNIRDIVVQVIVNKFYFICLAYLLWKVNQ